MLAVGEKVQNSIRQAVKRGEIYMCNLPMENGSVQANYRPVIILQNNKGNLFSRTTVVAPLSRKYKNLPTHVKIAAGVGGIIKESYVYCEQIMTIDKSWLDKYVGKLDIESKEFKVIERAVLISLGFQ